MIQANKNLIIQFFSLSIVYFYTKKIGSFLFFNEFFLDPISLHFNYLNLLVLFSYTLMVGCWEMWVLIVLFIVICLIFVRSSLISIYVFFELSLIPIFLIILSKGKQYERIKARIYLLFFTLFASLPLLVLILSLKLQIISSLIIHQSCDMKFSWIRVFFILAFFVKLPVFFFHIWLPKAHVEAPVFGSIVLAGLMLKLGGWGLYKIIGLVYKIWGNLSTKLRRFLFLGLIISSFYCLILRDLKIIIAVSSVRHMGLASLRLMNLSNHGLMGSMLILISHGFLSPALFFIVNCFYERLLSRSIIFSKRVFSFYISFILLVFLVANFCFPPSLNFFREIFIFIAASSWRFFCLFFIFVYILIRTIYSLFIFVSLSRRPRRRFNSPSLFLREIFILWLYLFIIFMYFLMIEKII